MTLNAVTRGVLRDAPAKIIVYGPGGIGKTTLASKAQSAIFLPTEDGTNQLDIVRMPRASRLADVFEALDELTTTKHDFRTLVVDTLTGIDTLVERHTCDANGWSSLGDPGYGKGPVAAFGEWLRVLAAFERFQAETNMHLVFLGHSALQKITDPDANVGEYLQFNLAINDAKVSGLWHNWSDANLFANYEIAKKSEKAKQVISSGNRYLYTAKRPAFVAKNRYGLPDRLPLDWDALWSGISLAAPESPEKLRREIEAMSAFVSFDVGEQIGAAVKAAKDDARELARIHNKLSAMVEIKEEKGEAK
jgi:hypothetical protein